MPGGSLLIKEETLAFTEAEIHFKTETENPSADSTTRSEQVDRKSSVIQECEKDFIIKLEKLILIKPKSANNTTFSSASSTSPATEKEYPSGYPRVNTAKDHLGIMWDLWPIDLTELHRLGIHCIRHIPPPHCTS
ncbi:hypothetical protein QJS10_CPB11g00727 [Acorus calamus]|uniref:Uncharacterized protein n=1 Tax=Acorus calamus TaxID=4465 RepID=A0AAV9DUS8_ACOCL|nr:hypothetical protein QJS10_CPB11g00727 [Acorus calamus]